MMDTWNAVWLQFVRPLGLYGKTLDVVEPMLDVGGIHARGFETIETLQVEDNITRKIEAIKARINTANKP